MAFIARFDIGADASVPHQINTHLQYRANQFVRLHRCCVGIQKLANFGTQPNRLGLSQKDSTALGDQVVVIVGPSRAWHFEQSLTFPKTRWHVRIRVEKDVLMIKCCDELDLA